MSQLNSQLIQDFNQSRHIQKIQTICHAPSVNMYFNSYGHVGACWLTLEKAPRYPDQSLRQIWFGEYFQKLRKNIKEKNLTEFCSVCEKRIRDRVFPSVLAQAYDLEYEFQDYPAIMEFELSNLCNLACVMCKGTLSSKIRKDREQMPALQSPYDDPFVEELVEFLPHLKEARFNGGEPFLQAICWKIWEKIAEINPDIMITAATNGTLLTEKMKRVLEKCRFRLNVSLDSLNKKTYESIRIGSHFEKVIENIGFYKDYCARKKTILSIMVNPMRNNWYEMGDFVNWCNRHNYHLWLNTIWRPRHLAIWTLPSSEQKKIFNQLSQVQFQKDSQTPEWLFQHNVRVFENFVHNQLAGWIRDQEVREEQNQDYPSLVQRQVGSRKRFAEKHLYQDNKKIFESLEKKTSQVFSADSLYYYLLEQSEADIETHLLQQDSVQSLEWIYKICDYY